MPGYRQVRFTLLKSAPLCFAPATGMILYQPDADSFFGYANDECTGGDPTSAQTTCGDLVLPVTLVRIFVEKQS